MRQYTAYSKYNSSNAVSTKHAAAVPVVQNVQQHSAVPTVRNMQQYTAYSDISSALGTEHAAVYSIQ